MSQAATPAPVVFDPPLPVSFVVPTGAKYGLYQGATISLQYGGFGDLWGIPSVCIDVTTNLPCVFSALVGTPTPQLNQRWTPDFSIPYDPVIGVVTSGTTTYLVKPLDKEVRLAHVLPTVCSGAGLLAPAIGSVTLPTAANWIDPTPSAGTKPVFTTVPAPQVIHGVKQY